MNRLARLVSVLTCSLAPACGGGAETSPSTSSTSTTPTAAPAAETTIEPVDDLCGVVTACLGGREEEGLAYVIHTPAELGDIGCPAPPDCTFPADTIYVIASTPSGGGCHRETSFGVSPTAGAGARTATLSVTDVGTCEMAFLPGVEIAALHGVPSGAEVTVAVARGDRP